MFDSVGRELDPDARRRHAASLVVTGAAFAGLAGGLLVVAAWRAHEIAPAPAVEPIMALAEAPLEPDPLPAPAPRVRLGVPEAPPAVPPPDRAADPRPEPAAAPDAVPGGLRGLPQGDPNGDPEGVPEGTPLGRGPGGSGGGGDVRQITAKQVEVRKRVEPTWPAAARGLGLATVDCRVEVSIDPKGVPYEVAIDRCPSEFHAETRQTLLKWRWYPASVEGEPVRARFLLIVRFRP